MKIFKIKVDGPVYYTNSKSFLFNAVAPCSRADKGVVRIPADYFIAMGCNKRSGYYLVAKYDYTWLLKTGQKVVREAASGRLLELGGKEAQWQLVNSGRFYTGRNWNTNQRNSNRRY